MIRLKDIIYNKHNQFTEQKDILDKAIDIVKNPVDTVKKKLVPIFYDSKVIFSPEVQKQVSQGLISDAIIQDVRTAVNKTELVTSVTITSGLRPGSKTKSGNYSRHHYGYALDIGAINGKGWTSKQDAESKDILDRINELVDTFKTMGYSINQEKNKSKGLLFFGFPDHDDHIHVSNNTKKPSSYNKIKKIEQEAEANSIYTIGSQGTIINNVHDILINLQYDISKDAVIDTFGEQTLVAITAFQKWAFNDKSKHHGVLDPETLNRLYNLSKQETQEIISLNNDKTTDISKSYNVEVMPNIIKSIPTDGNGTAMIIWGGYPYAKFGPEFMEKNTPESIKLNKVIIYVQGDPSRFNLMKVWNEIPKDVKLNTIIGFSAGAKLVWKYINDPRFTFKGLIDPVIPNKYADVDILPDTAIWANPKNWPDENKNTHDNQLKLIKKYPLKPIYQELNQLLEMYPQYMENFEHDIIPGIIKTH
jgi:hypothetical protein